MNLRRFGESSIRGNAMTQEEKLERITAFETGYSRVDEIVSGIGREEMLFAPSLRDAWAINDFLVHFLDADLSLAFRVRTAIAEPGKAVPAWEEEAWHDFLRYDDEDGLACLSLAKGIRSFLAINLRSVVDSDWSGYSIGTGRVDRYVRSAYRFPPAFDQAK
jgi:hypothetical protein